MEENKTNVAQKKPNLALAILAAIGFALIGSVLYGVLYYFQYLAWIAAYVTVLLSALGYKLVNKKMDKKGYLIVALASILALFVSMFVALTLYVAHINGTTFSVACKQLFTLIDADSKVKAAVIRDGALTAVLALFGLLSYFFYELRLKKATQAPESQTSDTDTSKQEDQPAVAAEQVKPVETPKANTTAKAEAKPVEQQKTESPKPVATKTTEPAKATAPAEKKTTATPTPVEKKTTATTTTSAAKKTTTKRTTKKKQTTSTSRPLVIKPVVAAKPRANAKKDDKKGE